MARDPEKQELESWSQNHEGPSFHPDTSTGLGDDQKAASDTDSISIHSHSTETGTIEEKSSGIPERSKSRASTVRSRAVTIIPRAKRRGLLASFALVPEVSNPYEYKNKTKWGITLTVALAAAAAPIGSAVLLPALPELAIDLHTNTTITNLSVAMYMLSMSIFPLFWSSFSETLGRRSIYITSFTLFVLFNILSAVATGMPMLIVMRVLGGGAAASVQAVGAGSVADVWEVRERGRAMGIFYLGPLLGPLLAPIIGGALSQTWGWRSTQWFQVIYGGILLLVLIFFLPETLKRAVPFTITPSTTDNADSNSPLNLTLTRQSVQLKTRKLAAILKRCFIDPFAVIGYLRFPAVALSVGLASITFGSLYMLNISIQTTFSSPPYSFPTLIVGLMYIPNSLGYILASVLGGRWTDHIMAREARVAAQFDSSGKLIYRPEDRLRENVWLAALVFPVALIWYGWTVEKGVTWIAPAVANFFFGAGSMIVFGVVTTALTEFLPGRSSSAVAVNNFVRNIFSCVGGVVAQPLITAIGNGWLFTGLGVICFITGVGVLYSMRRYGPKWRVVMNKDLGIE